ncbi:hypothetical protein ABPG74_000490 [Tetrahymena malaccensis]
MIKDLDYNQFLVLTKFYLMIINYCQIRYKRNTIIASAINQSLTTTIYLKKLQFLIKTLMQINKQIQKLQAYKKQNQKQSILKIVKQILTNNKFIQNHLINYLFITFCTQFIYTCIQISFNNLIIFNSHIFSPITKNLNQLNKYQSYFTNQLFIQSFICFASFYQTISSQLYINLFIIIYNTPIKAIIYFQKRSLLLILSQKFKYDAINSQLLQNPFKYFKITLTSLKLLLI